MAIMRFPYVAGALNGPPPPSLPATATSRSRPLIPVRVIGPTSVFRDFPLAVLDTGADDTVFPVNLVHRLRIKLLPVSGHGVRWRGQLHAIRFGAVELEIVNGGLVWRWPTIVSFSPAPLQNPILGHAGVLQFTDSRFLGADLAIELEANRTIGPIRGHKHRTITMGNDSPGSNTTDFAAGQPPGEKSLPVAYCPKCGGVMASADPVCLNCGYDFPMRDPTPPGYRVSWFADCILIVATVIAGLASLLLLIASVMLLGTGRFGEALVAIMGTVLFLGLVIVFTRVQDWETRH